MRRREVLKVIAASTAGWPLAARAQQPAMPTIGFLSGRSPATDSDLVAAFQRALSEAGYVNGQNVAIEFRWTDGELDRLPELLADLVARKVTVIFAGAADVVAGALRVAAATVPVVFATGSDPVTGRLVASMNRPGGNLTGVTVITNQLWPKRLELLREWISPIPLVAFLINWNNVNHAPAMRELNDVARRIGQDVMVLNANAESDIETAFATLAEKHASALVVSDDALFNSKRAAVVALAARHAVPTIYGRREFTAIGGLTSYGASTLDQYYQSGVYVGRILKGAKPADLPFLQPTKFEFTINLKTAKKLGLGVPPTLLSRADEVIE
jgi:putative ABC transport system substrate-binding protein